MLSVVLIVIDQLIKYYVFINQPQKVLIPEVLSITYAQNTGTLFGMAQGSNHIFVITSLIIIAAIVFIIFKRTEKYSVKRKFWQLILAGGIGNLIDRIYRGFVIDYVFIKYFGVCNFADFCIVIGVIILIIEEIKNILNKKNNLGH